VEACLRRTLAEQLRAVVTTLAKAEMVTQSRLRRADILSEMVIVVSVRAPLVGIGVGIKRRCCCCALTAPVRALADGLLCAADRGTSFSVFCSLS
jgi:hypothetical protein